ncbi:transcription antitermination factor NusB [Sporofaciens sp. SGI.106]|uniref:transcription antitermination factor NusB n=1 Tax=Sporofaciens sp. SGI.106 TaxID=3420568 RepID=UPI002A9886F9|nr:transcription antitermination factor NusB [Lachnoclostridium sp.]
MKRSEQREHIFKMVFEIEFNTPEEMKEQKSLYFEQNGITEDNDREYIGDKADAVASKAKEIDDLLNENVTGWKTGRMNKVDLSILRLAIYEMKWDDDVPVSVAINEAVELAKRFGGEESPAFVNGILAKFAE